MSKERNIEPLSTEELYTYCSLDDLSFSRTDELDDDIEIMGQEKAMEALSFALGVKQDGYNVFVLGPPGSGKHALVDKVLLSKNLPDSSVTDWCYVYNFEDELAPLIIETPTGTGPLLSNSMNGLIQSLQISIPAIFQSDEYRYRYKIISDTLKKKQSDAFHKIQKAGDKNNIRVIQSDNGIEFLPLKKEEQTSVRISTESSKNTEKKIAELKLQLNKLMNALPAWAHTAEKEYRKLEKDITCATIKESVDEIRKEFPDLPIVSQYLNSVEEDINKNIVLFKTPLDSGSLGAGKDAPITSDTFVRYQINVLVSREPSSNKAIVYLDNPTYQGLIGSIEHIVENGALKTDFTQIRPGALHRANGGYLVIDARKIIENPHTWEALKRALRARLIRIEDQAQSVGVVSTKSLNPNPIKLDIKVILIGERALYYALDQNDRDFRELFKVTSDLENKLDRTKDNNMKFAKVLATFCKTYGLKPLTANSVAKLCDHSARISGNAKKMSTQMQYINDIVREANYFAEQEGNTIIDRSHVKIAIKKALERVSRIPNQAQEQILEDTVLIDTASHKVGQINGLAVLRIGRVAYGKPSRITAKTRLGIGEVIDIEREVQLGGPIHSKGVFILASYLASKYATDRPLSLSASIVFEQSYSGVDGDSASSTELYAILSALSKVPINQGLAVTGAVNQNGEIQAIGGANEKIEGFFDICNARGLTGNQGVIIPSANIKNLMLKKEVRQAVDKKMFYIYAVSHIDDGIEILTGTKAGVRSPSGSFPVKSINQLVEKQLYEFADQRQRFEKA